MEDEDRARTLSDILARAARRSRGEIVGDDDSNLPPTDSHPFAAHEITASLAAIVDSQLRASNERPSEPGPSKRSDLLRRFDSHHAESRSVSDESPPVEAEHQRGNHPDSMTTVPDAVDIDAPVGSGIDILPPPCDVPPAATPAARPLPPDVAIFPPDESLDIALPELSVRNAETATAGPPAKPPPQRPREMQVSRSPMRYAGMALLIALLVVGVLGARHFFSAPGSSNLASNRPAEADGLSARMIAPAASPGVLQPTVPSAPAVLSAAISMPSASEVAPAAGPVVGLVTDRQDAVSSWVTDELERPMAGRPPVTFAPIRSDSWITGLQALGVQPRVAVVRYDVLRAARALSPASRVPSLQVLAPIAAEPIFFVVRADSPLHSLHDIKTRHINIGPPGGARALTARTLYRQMFGTEPLAADQTTLNEDAALESLAAFKSLEVVVIVGSSPQSALRRFSPLSRHGLRLLTLDSSNADDRRLLASYLPVPVAEDLPGEALPAQAMTPGIVSFLVTAKAAGNDQHAHDAAMRSLAEAWCDRLPRLDAQQSGSWVLISPGLQVDVGWPYSTPAQDAFERCTTSSRPS